MIYARVHDETVAQDYYEAMAVIEKQLELQLPPQISAESETSQMENSADGDQLLALADTLADSVLDDWQRQLVDELRNGIVALVG